MTLLVSRFHHSLTIYIVDKYWNEFIINNWLINIMLKNAQWFYSCWFKVIRTSLHNFDNGKGKHNLGYIIKVPYIVDLILKMYTCKNIAHLYNVIMML